MKRIVSSVTICVLFFLLSSVVKSEESVTCMTLPVLHEERRVEIIFSGNQGDEISYEILAPQKNLPLGTVNENLMEIFALVGQVKLDENGTASVYYLPDRGLGDYTVRANGADTVRWCFADLAEVYALGWNGGFDGKINQSNVTELIWLDSSIILAEDTAAAAENVKAKLDEMPEGRRGLMLDSKVYSKRLSQNAENYAWWDTSGQQLKQELENFFIALRQAGAQVDYFICDFEEGMTIWHLGHSNDEALTKYQSIESDMRYETDIRPYLEERGFIFPEDEDSSELYDVCYWQKADNNNYLIFNKVMNNRRAAYVRECFFEPFLESYPDGICSNYAECDLDAALEIMSSGYETYLGGNGYKSGTHSAPSLYANLFKSAAQIGCDGEIIELEQDAFTGLITDQNKLRAIRLSTDEGKIQAWISRQNWTANDYYYGNTAFWYENILHTGLNAPDSFLFWGPQYSKSDDTNMLVLQTELLSDVLTELELVLGKGAKAPLETELAPWDNHFLLSGMSVDNRKVWRITPDISGDEKITTEFCINEEIPTFTDGKTTISFPECSIYTYPESHASGGYWIVGDETAEPVITYSSSSGGEYRNIIHLYDVSTGSAANEKSLTNGVVVRYSYKNNSASEKNILLFSAGYNQNRLVFGDLLDNRSVQAGESRTQVYKIIPDNKVDQIKVFLWQAGTLEPLSKMAYIP